jgi:hypothetical protein
MTGTRGQLLSNYEAVYKAGREIDAAIMIATWARDVDLVGGLVNHVQTLAKERMKDYLAYGEDHVEPGWGEHHHDLQALLSQSREWYETFRAEEDELNAVYEAAKAGS